ncbi:uncharacterized protein NFIA_102740 [Aspergillus fischeri NRRL 181]|uniref:Uncharacterized protein n=1 Tax=Neosartorya fischeri (strain ATCC 1020 / DSM 3700 / CBS 544.65 / FGSC A1164 / JCM 1740 / NRRL 181 / WB 181) TaxID=331117 RepID=A1CVY7_NEOFI|nr:uncharacterized protein NFIA_102740 [Aspergillus fischeri NRRL 181]EAW24789.1 hypothetical protein NFIA_102740 [Aspergillus fischeri NRRL 181]
MEESDMNRHGKDELGQTLMSWWFRPSPKARRRIAVRLYPLRWDTVKLQFEP